MFKKSLFALAGLVLLAACAEPPMGPSTSPSGGSELQGPSRETCPAPRPNPPTDLPTAQARQCVPIQ
jgi:hypothetical protein